MKTVLALLVGLFFAAPPVWASTTPGKPQILIAVTNSESMDGDVSGAIYTGSGTVTGLASSTSPADYTPSNGFIPPVQGAGSNGMAAYTVTNSAGQEVDNGPSRLNMAKQAVQSLLSTYLGNADFALETYATRSTQTYQTWVYYMSGPNGFTFSTSAQSGADNVANPCYHYSSSGSSALSRACQSLQSLYGSGFSNDAYMQIAATSDASDINDVLYTGGLPPVFILGSPYPSSAFPPNFSAYNYEHGQVAITYYNSVPYGYQMTLTPTNAGYIGTAAQVMFAQRGFGFGTVYSQDLSASSGNVLVGMQTSGAAPGTQASINSALSAFTPYLAAETQSANTKEIKAVAGQSPMAGLLAQANSYLAKTKNSSCAGQYVVLLTDGLPTMGTNGLQYPPLGSASANAYGFTATFNSDGSLASTNDAALQDTVNAVQALLSAGVKTYIVGLGAGVDGSINPVAAKTLTALAVAGGTGQAYAANSQSSLNAALNAILNGIETSSAISAPIAPFSLSKGSYAYILSSDSSPLTAHVKAYSVASSGASTSASWDASTMMTPAQRRVDLLSTDTSGNVVAFNALDAAAFALTPTACVPDIATIENYVADPTFTYVDSAGATCTYLAGRSASSPLGPLGSSNAAVILAPSSNAALLNNATYVKFAQGTSSRATQLLFTDSDGFLYSVNASTGALMWGWMPRPFVSQMQSISTVFQQGLMDGGVTITDAQDSSGNWATYLVGTAESGAYHYGLKLDSTGKPSVLAWDSLTAGYSSPQGQAPVIVRTGTTAYAVYILNNASGSTLVEQPVAGGAATTASLKFSASSTLVYESSSGSLYVGDSSGNLWQLPVSGTASADAKLATDIGATVDGAAAQYVGIGSDSIYPLAWVAAKSSFTVFLYGPSGWQELWSATTSAGTYSGTQGDISTQALPEGAQVSGNAVLVNNVLSLPIYIPNTSSDTCGPGTGELMFFSPLTGQFPDGQVWVKGQTKSLTGTLAVGQGQAYTPSFSLGGGQGVTMFPGGMSTLIPMQLQVGQNPADRVIGWTPI